MEVYDLINLSVGVGLVIVICTLVVKQLNAKEE
jgi:hypothetical protein